MLEYLTLVEVISMVKKQTSSLTVYASNSFVDCFPSQEWHEIEQKIMWWCCCNINQTDMELYNKNQNKVISISVKELVQDLEISASPKFYYTYFKNLARDIATKTLTSKSEDSFINLVIFPTFIYKDGQITIKLNADVIPFLLDLKSNYTKFHFQNIARLGSRYAIKLYTLLKQYQKTGKRSFSIDDLYLYFCITKKQYPRYSNFKQKILELSVKHINNSTDLNISYTENKVLRKVVELEFFIKEKEQESLTLATTPDIEELKRVVSLFYNLATFDANLEKVIKEHLHTKGNNYVVKAMLYTCNKKPKNMQAYLIQTLKKGWGQDIAIGELEHNIITRLNSKK